MPHGADSEEDGDRDNDSEQGLDEAIGEERPERSGSGEMAQDEGERCKADHGEA